MLKDKFFFLGKKISLGSSDVEGVAIKEVFRCFKTLFMFLNFLVSL